MLYAGLSLLSLCALAVSKPLPRHRTHLHLHDRRDALPAGFTLLGQASPDIMLNLRIALVQSDPAGLESKLYDVSTPSSANYGTFLNKSEAAAYSAPTPESLSAVTAWLQSNGINASVLTPAQDWLAFQVPVAQANSMLAADFSVFMHNSSGQQTVRTLAYSVPADLKAHIDFVYPTTSMTKPSSRLAFTSARHRRGSPDTASASCADTVTPACLQELYGIPTTPATQASNQLLVTGYDNQFANKDDLQSFLSQARPDISSSTSFALQTLDGGQNTQSEQLAGDEANLDIQYTVGLATGVPVTFFSVGADNHDGDLDGFLDTINALLALDDPPQTMTTSYGFDESDLPFALANNLCNAYAQLGARGVSIMFASGDGGVSGSQASSCTEFVPTFPASCPFVTAVGATTGTGPEAAASFSSGGFSNFFAQPSFQASAVSSYLSALGKTNRGLFNASGRGYPDVSAQGVNFGVVIGGAVAGVDGTSCASPTFASAVALLNDARAARGAPALGFLNPLLYAHAGALFDVAAGSNPGCGTQGFPALPGWDAVTGLGTPNFPALQSAAGV